MTATAAYPSRPGAPLVLDAPTLAQAYGLEITPRAADIPAHLARLLPMLAANLTRAQIAARLGLRQGGVDARMKRLYALLGAHSRTGAVRTALEIGLLPRATKETR